MIKFRSSAQYDKPATVIFIPKDKFKKLNLGPVKHPSLRKILQALHKNGQFEAEFGELFPIALDKKIVLLAGTGQIRELTATTWRNLVRQTLTSSYLKGSKEAEVISPEQKDFMIKGIIDGFLIGTYVWEKYKSDKKPQSSPRQMKLTVVASPKKAYTDAVTTCEGVTLARDLVNDNADVVTATHFENVVRKLVKGHKKATLKILNRKELKAAGLNLHLAVNQGSNKEPKLIIVQYKGASKKGGYTAIVGKGMTFDTGGLNLKPSGHIETMRCDMSGAAAVVGTLANTLALKLKKNVLFVLGMAENATSRDAYKPGDVFKSFSGKTVEIGNTDAEGRLVLADALAYTIKNYKPARVIDIATLTGACIIALGYDYTGLVASDDAFSRHLIRASNETDDRAWRLPSYPELKDSVRSPIADIRNLGFAKGAGGTITAAEFLRQFTEGLPWAHLDIAGTAFMEGSGRNYYAHGATGSGVRLLTEYLKSH